MVSNRRGCLVISRLSRSLLTVVALILIVGILQPLAFGNPQKQDAQSKQIEVRLTPKKESIRAGEALEVRVDIWNVGTNELFIEKGVYEACTHSPLSLYLESRPLLKVEGPEMACAGDCLDDPTETITNRLVEHWIPLPVGHSYGAIVRMEPDFFPQLRTPGSWLLHGTYSSDGDLTKSFCLNPVILNREQIERLPYRGWKGKQNTNIVRIEVLDRMNRSN
jgi:hypothetical protein